MATSSSTFRDRDRRPRLVEQGQPPAAQVTRTEGKGEEEEKETRDWAELPRDALLAVFHRLHQADVLMGAEHVCRPWRVAVREEPELWRRVDLRGRVALASPAGVLEAMAYAAATSGGGRCEAFWVEGIRDDSFVLFLSCTAPTLKSLRLISCSISTGEGLVAGIRELPVLKELELSLYSGANLAVRQTCAAAAEACPLLKRLRLSRYRFDWRCGVGDDEAMGIARMRSLRSLQLFGNDDGLAAILDGCVGLESLDIRHCFNVNMNDEMRAMCVRVPMLRLPQKTPWTTTTSGLESLRWRQRSTMTMSSAHGNFVRVNTLLRPEATV